MEEEEHAWTPIQLIFAIIDLVSVIVVTFFGYFVLNKMIKHKTFQSSEWRVKLSLLAYVVLGTAFFFWLFITKVWNYEEFAEQSLYSLTICTWTAVHWQFDVYYLRTACLLKVAF